MSSETNTCSPTVGGLLKLYYRVRPPIAEFITAHASLKPIVRLGLLHAVVMSTIIINGDPA